MSRVYLDHNATAPLRAEARAAMVAAMDVVGNPSSVHAEGRAAKAIVERARAQVAAAFGARPDQIVFNSGATEAAAMAAPDGAGVPSAVEHDAVRNAFIGPAGVELAVDGSGRAVLGPFVKALTGADPGVSGVALQLANSETGVMQDVSAGVGALHAADGQIQVTVDAVQAAGKIPFSFAWMGADFLLLSAHKIGGPKGVGAIATKSGEVGARYAAFAPRGTHEQGRRAGTENVIGIAGFGAAAEAAQKDLEAGVWDGVAHLRNILETTIEAEANETIFVGKDAPRLPNTSCFATPGWKGETQVMQMDLAGFAVSAGSACSSGKVRESRVLRAMGYDERVASSAIRVSLGPTNTEDEVLRFCEAWLEKLRKHRARAA